MNNRTRDRRILVLALAAVLALRLLAWGGGEDGLVHAGQTIPTRTPTPSALDPTRTPVPGLPTEAPSPTSGAAATATLPPGAELTATLPPGSSATQEAPTPASGTLLPTTDAATSPTASTGPLESATAGAGEPTATPPTPVVSPGPPIPGSSPDLLLTPLPVAAAPEGAAEGGAQEEADDLAAVLMSPCLWIGLGLLLVAAGSAILVARRRAL